MTEDGNFMSAVLFSLIYCVIGSVIIKTGNEEANRKRLTCLQTLYLINNCHTPQKIHKIMNKYEA